MKRPLAVIGFSYSSALLAAFLFGLTHLTALIIIVSAVVPLSIFLRIRYGNSVFLAIVLSSLAAMGTLYFYNLAYVNNTNILMENEVKIKADICELPYEQNNRVYYKLKTTEIDFPDCPQEINILISTSKALRAEPFDTIETTVRFYSKADRERASDIARGVYLRGSIVQGKSTNVIKQDNKPLYYYAAAARKAILDIIDKDFITDHAPYIKALLIGDRSGLSYDDSQVFRNAGISHIIVASGFHLAVLVGIVMATIMFLFRCRRNTASIFCIAFVFAYMAIVGFTPSIMRAGIMMIIAMLGRFAFREADSLNSLGIAVLIICFLDPYAVCDAGFLLSVSATAGIVTMSERLTGTIMEKLQPVGSTDSALRRTLFYEKHKRGIKVLVSYAAVSFSALLFTYPITVICFRMFALYALLANLLISFPASILLELLFLLVIAEGSVIFGFLRFPLILLCEMITRYILWTADNISRLPYAGMKASYEYVPIMLVLTFAAVTVYYFLAKRKKRETLTVLFASALLFFTVGSTFDTLAKTDSTKLSVLDTGNGLSVILTRNSESAVLSCGGSYDKSAEIQRYLSDSSVSEIGYFLISDKNAQTSAYAENLLKEYHIRTIQVYDEEKLYERLHRRIIQSDRVVLSKAERSQTEKSYCCGTEIEVYRSPKSNAARFVINDTVYVICHSGTDCSCLPLSFRKCDVLIMDGSSERTDILKAGQVILSDSPSMLEQDMDNMKVKAEQVYYTAGYGDIGIRHYKDGRMKINRENNWLN